MYAISDNVLRRDFRRFQQDGVNVISLILKWYRLEGPTRGDYAGEYSDGSPYGKPFLDNVKHVLSIASEYDIKVLITFDFWRVGGEYAVPDYVVDPVTGTNSGFAIVTDENMKQAYLDMFNHTVQYLSGTPGIWAWAILNEPYYYWDRHIYGSLKESFIDLFQKLSNIVKTVDGRPTTIRFIGISSYGNKIFEIDWEWDQRIFDILDFISFNVYPLYPPEVPELFDTVLNLTEEMIIKCHSQFGKGVWITEFGVYSDDDSVQVAGYERILATFSNFPVDGWLSHMWASDSWTFPPTGFAGKGWNICANADTGEPRPAYNVLIQSSPKLL